LAIDAVERVGIKGNVGLPRVEHHIALIPYNPLPATTSFAKDK
jgi:hypothetical protein